MYTLIQKVEKLPLTALKAVLIFLAILVAAQIQYIQHNWINPDSVLYFESARLLAVGEWHAAVKVFNWPLYAACIALIHKITSLDIQLSAQILNVIFFGITATSFLKLIELAKGKSLQMLAGMLILLSSHYIVGDILGMLMRDEGFWAFFLTSLVFFIRFYKSQRYLDAFFWQISIIIAVLFRIEAISYLLLLPISLLSNKQFSLKQRSLFVLKSNFLCLIAFTCIFAAVLTSNTVSMDYFGRLDEVFTVNLYDELTEKFFTNANIMSTQVLGKYLEEFAVQGLLLTFAYVIIIKIISATGLVNIGLAALTIQAKNRLIDDQAYRVLSVTACISVFNMALIITKVFVLSGRYVLALSMILMVFAAFYLADMFQYLSSKHHSKRKWAVAFLLIFMLLSLVKNILPKQSGYNYMQESATWLSVHNKAKKPVFYDDTRVRYFAGAPFIGTWNDNSVFLSQAITDKSIYEHEYLIITQSIKRPQKQELMDELPGYLKIKRFNDAKSKKFIVIYQKRADISLP